MNNKYFFRFLALQIGESLRMVFETNGTFQDVAEQSTANMSSLKLLQNQEVYTTITRSQTVLS